MKQHENKLFIILTKNKIINKIIEEDQRVAFFKGDYNLLKSFTNWDFSDVGQKSTIEECNNIYLTSTPYSDTEPKGEIILDIDSDEADGAISYLDHLAEKFKMSCTIDNIKTLFDIKLITDNKVDSDWIPLSNQVALIDIESFKCFENKNGISFIDTIEKIEYLKDNIKIIIDNFINSKLKTLDIYCLIKEEIGILEEMKEETLTSFSYLFENKKLNIFSYPSTNIGVTVAEIE